MVASRNTDPTFRTMPETPLDGDSRKLPTYDNTNPDAIEVWKLYVEAILDQDNLLSCLEPIADLATFKASLPSEELAASEQHEVVKAYNLHVDAMHAARRRAYNKIATLPGVPSMRTREFIESKNLHVTRDATRWLISSDGSNLHRMSISLTLPV